MPLQEIIIDLPSVKLVSAQGERDLVCQAIPAEKPVCIHCGCQDLRCKGSRTRRLRHFRIGNRLLLLDLQSPKYRCKSCGRYFQQQFSGVLPRKRSTEAFRQDVFERHLGGIAQSLLAQTHSISAATVERWTRDFLERRNRELVRPSCPRVLGIDEHFFTRKQGFATTVVDLGKHRVFDVVLGRTERALGPYLSALPGRERVQVVVMDLSETYRSIVRRHFPQARIVADRFHVVRLLNHHFLKVWQQLDPLGRKSRGLLSLMRRHAWNLLPNQQLRLESYFQQIPALRAVYDFKQRLTQMLLLKTLTQQAARRRLPEFLHLVKQLTNTPFEPLRQVGETFTRWLPEIVRMWRFSKTNSITEGFHTKMEMLSRRAFGFRNFKNYRLRVLALCAWNGINNRVWPISQHLPPRMV